MTRRASVVTRRSNPVIPGSSFGGHIADSSLLNLIAPPFGSPSPFDRSLLSDRAPLRGRWPKGLRRAGRGGGLLALPLASARALPEKLCCRRSSSFTCSRFHYTLPHAHDLDSARHCEHASREAVNQGRGMQSHMVTEARRRKSRSPAYPSPCSLHARAFFTRRGMLSDVDLT